MRVSGRQDPSGAGHYTVSVGVFGRRAGGLEPGSSGTASRSLKLAYATRTPAEITTRIARPGLVQRSANPWGPLAQAY